jgi:hypothetical protein
MLSGGSAQKKDRVYLSSTFSPLSHARMNAFVSWSPAFGSPAVLS